MSTLSTISQMSFFFPKITLEDHLRQASSDSIAILTNSPSKVVPELESGDKVRNAIIKLATILNNANTTLNLPKFQNTDKQVPLPRMHDPPNKSSSLPRVNYSSKSSSPLLRVNKSINNTQLLDKLPKHQW